MTPLKAMIASTILISSAAYAAGTMTAPDAEFCDPDFCAKTLQELKDYHAETPFTDFDPAKVTVVMVAE